MTDYDKVPTAVRSMKLGAEDYIPKKLIEDNLFPLLKNLRKRMERQEAPIYERQSAAPKSTSSSGLTSHSFPRPTTQSNHRGGD